MKINGKALKSIKHIANATFPEYKGRKYFVQPAEKAPRELRSYWDEGSRTYYAFYNLDTNQVLPVHSNHPFFEPNQPSRLSGLPEHVVLVSRSISCGRECGITFYGHMPKLLPDFSMVES